MTSKALRLVAVAMGVLLLFASDVQGLNLVFISLGTPSDLLQMAPLVREAYQRNHSATVLVDTLGLSDCKDVFRDSFCTAVTCSQRGCRDKTADLSRAFLTVLRQRSLSPDVILAAAFLYEADRISAQLGVPLVILSGSAGDVPSIRSTFLHVLPFDLGERCPLLEAVVSAIRGFYASAWELIGFGPSQNFQMIRHIVTQGIPGIDITGPFCPSVHPVGFLRGDGEVLVKKSFSAVDAYIESCGGRFIYTTMPADNSAHGQQLYSALRAVANETSACVLWYVLSAQQSSLRFPKPSEAQRVKVTDDDSAAPHYVLHRHHPVVVLSKDVKEILYDAVLAESPIVLIGSNSFSCSQLRNAGIAACASSSRTTEVVSAVQSVYNKSSVQEQLRAARRLGFLMGGAQKAVEVAELVAAVGTGSIDFACDRSILLSPYGYDAAIAVLATLFLGVLLCVGPHCLYIPLKQHVVWKAHGKERLS
ncbi:hypothetical protein JIQ42_00938 [Leishmania sp. Namibia]|uniref:hypothetical protein n=1 Tax=Leishmania sp. Namibia TaxID=2802991 RepID=UPI001B45D7F9|nr:hypothetical protein JIQ42_00938 [Leishmania sp. Namibia]